MSGFLSAVRLAGRAPAIALSVSLIVVGTAVAQDVSPPGDAAAGSPVATTAPSDSGPELYPLPEIVAVIPADIPTVRLEPESEPAAIEVGVAEPFTLGHCGLLSPLDLNGSFWQPVGGTSANGGPIADDGEIGELINATDGELVFTSPDTAVFTTVMGSHIELVRATSAVDYPLCM